MGWGFVWRRAPAHLASSPLIQSPGPMNEWIVILPTLLTLYPSLPRSQAALKLEAAASCVEEQLKSREAVEAENAAIAARAAEDEAQVRVPSASL